MGRQFCKIIALLAISVAGCVKDKPAQNTVHEKTGHIFIVCEGSFGSGNSSLWSYNAATNTVSGDIFSAVNSTTLGDVFQSMNRAGHDYLLCINNSDKLFVADTATMAVRGSVNISKPRYAIPAGNTAAFVSTLYSNKIEVVDLASLSVKRSIELPHNNPEGMCKTGAHMYVCPWDTLCNHIYEIDETSLAVTREIDIAGYAPHAVLADKYGMLWVLSGNATKGRQAALTRIDPSTGATLKSYQFGPAKDPVKPVFNPTRDTLYFIQVKYDGSAADNGIYRMHINDTSLPLAPFIAAGKFQYFWALGIDPANGHIYVGDPKGFVQKGAVSIYKPDGTIVNNFDVGIGPGQFFFGD